MSDKIEKCEAVKVTKNFGTYPYCFLGSDDKPACTYEATEEECGLNLEKLPRNNPQLVELFKTARGTLSANVLSRTDALRMSLINDIIGNRDNAGICTVNDSYKDCLERCGNPHCMDGCFSHSGKVSKSCLREVAEAKLADHYDVRRIFESLPANRRIAIQKAADRFYTDAGALVQKMKGAIAPSR